MTRSLLSTISKISSGGFIKVAPLGGVELLCPKVEVHGQQSFQLFPSLRKPFFDEGVEGGKVGRKGGMLSETKNGRVNLGPRVKNFRGQMTNLLDRKNGLKQNGNSSVRARPRESTVPICHLLLQSNNHRLRRGRSQGELNQKGCGDGVRKVTADQSAGGSGGEGFEGISLNQTKTWFVLKFFSEPSDEALVDLKSLDGVSQGKESSGEGAEARPDLLDGLGFGFWKGMGDDGGEGGFGQKVLAKLPQGAEAAGGQNFADLRCVQS